jgi:hypothetical protein
LFSFAVTEYHRLGSLERNLFHIVWSLRRARTQHTIAQGCGKEEHIYERERERERERGKPHIYNKTTPLITSHFDKEFVAL